MPENEARIISELDREGLKFLDRDFNQCFQQMRHYDSQIFEICKFGFLAYTTIVGATVGLYQFGLPRSALTRASLRSRA